MRTLTYLLVIIFLSSCSAKLSPFTQRMYEDFGWSDRELKKIQFYLSDDILLWRENGNDATSIKNGKIRVRDGRKVEEVIFKKGTPGVLVFSPKENRFAVSFEDHNDKFLMFGPNPKMNNRYVLLGREWSKRQGKVTYDGKVYNTSARNAFTSLLVDIKEARSYRRSTSVAEGRKIRT